MKKLIILFTSLYLFTFNIYSQVVNDSQIIQGNHWVYDAFNSLALESATGNFTANTPLTAGELKIYFNMYDKESLSEAGQLLYDKIQTFLYSPQNLFPGKAYEVGLGLSLNPELLYKSNKEIDWIKPYYYKAFPLIIDVDTGIDNYFAAGGDFFIGKNHFWSLKDNNLTNLPTGFDQIEFMFPRFAYGSIGFTKDNWGINLNVGKEGLKIGNTKTGSIILNDTFENESYIQFKAFSQDFKYTMDIIQISPEKILYHHEFDVRFWKKLKIGLMEFALINEPFEVRFMNPFMVFHSFSFWRNYYTDVEKHYYNEAHAASYLGVTFEYNPVKYLRLYLLYAMNEMQMPNERYGKNLAYPDSFGGQLGAELKIPTADGGYWNSGLELLYTSPYLYIKQAPEWSLYKTREDMITFKDVKSWIGSPSGPDTFLVNASFGYEKVNKWSCGFTYQMKLKGENDFNLFDKNAYYQDKTYDGKEVKIWTYYPYTKYQIAEDNSDQAGMDSAIAQARSLWISGCRECRHDFAIEGMYTINDQLKIQGQLIYELVFNANHQAGNLQQGVEAAISLQYKVF